MISRRHECIIFYSMQTFQFWAYTMRIYAFFFHFHHTLFCSSMPTFQFWAFTMHICAFFFTFIILYVAAVCTRSDVGIHHAYICFLLSLSSNSSLQQLLFTFSFSQFVLYENSSVHLWVFSMYLSWDAWYIPV